MNREKEIVKVSFIGIIGNVLLVVFKAIVGIFAHSVSIILDAVNNLTDALSSGITIVGTKLSTKRPDKKHPYGHGRVEYLTSAIIAVIILAAGGTAIYESIKSLIDKTEATYEIYSFVIIGVAVLVKIGLGLFFRYKGKKLRSEPLKGSGIDALFDAILSLSTLVGAIISKYTGVHLEGYLGILIGLFILKSGIDVLRSSFSLIIGERIDPALSKQLKEEIKGFPEVHGVYDLIVNNYGEHRSIGSVHIGVDETLQAKEIQRIEREIQELVFTKYGIILTVGIYAENQSNELAVKIKEALMQEVRKYPTILQIHGFYLDEAKKTVTFDIVFDFEEKDYQNIKNSILQSLQEAYPNFHFVCVIDQDISLSI
ncbi:MAG: cation transporter [Bacilli bacterium]|nr:cation transporter [Bacilli bacterium]